MPDQWSQSSTASPIIYPIALQPHDDEAAEPQARTEPWGWLELFVLAQVFWGVLLFMPGSQAFRVYIRAFPYMASLIALGACARSGSIETRAPGAPWLFAVMALLLANLVHVSTSFTAGIAQIVFQLAIAAPIFWVGRMWISEKRLERLVWLIFAANLASAVLGLLQVYYPDQFLPPEFSSLALQMNPDFINELTYIGASGQVIIRPPGLSDLPGGAAIAGTIAALLGFAFAVRTERGQHWRFLYVACALAGITVVYLTQVRSMLLMILGCMATMALIRLRQGRIVQSGWTAALAGALVFGSFTWAVTVGGEIVEERFRGIIETGVVQTYQENRGFFLDYTLSNLVFEYPFGAGLGRWGMMFVYFSDPGNWQYPQLHAELQPTGWLLDGGVLMWVFYGGALLLAMRHSYRMAIESTGLLNDLAAMVFSIQLLIAGLCFTGPVFNTQVGLLFWLSTAILYGAERTGWLEALSAEEEEEAEALGAEEETSA
jgi:hypothetical protein